MFEVTFSPEVEFAIGAVRKACDLTQHVRATTALTKTDSSPVTVADFSAQAIVARLLKDSFPGDALVAEEDSAMLKTSEGEETLEQVAKTVQRANADATPELVCEWIDYGAGEPSGRFWVLDPVDGTKGFLRGGQYAIALALVVDGKVELGVLGCPNLGANCQPDICAEGAMAVAARGEGAWTTSLKGSNEFTKLEVSSREDISEATLLRSFESGHTNVGTFDLIVKATNTKCEPISLDSQAKYAVLASGCGDLLFRLLSDKQPDYREKIWDQAAGSIVIEEAGGKITDLNGKDLDFTAGRTLANNVGILASNGHMHDDALKIVGDVLNR